jgi:hypothetical protein
MKTRKNDASQRAKSPSRLIDARIKELGDWRGKTLSRIRDLIKQADRGVTEEWKWRSVPVWYHDGMICTGETYKNIVKVTFAKGAELKDPAKLFNSGLEGNVTCHRPVRRRQSRRLRFQGAHPPSSGAEQVGKPRLVREIHLILIRLPTLRSLVPSHSPGV